MEALSILALVLAVGAFSHAIKCKRKLDSLQNEVNQLNDRLKDMDDN